MIDITRPCRDVSELSQQAQKACKLFMDKCKAKGLNVLIVETRRPQERQNYLYCQGRTVTQATAKGINKDFATKYCNPKVIQVTWTLNSNHKSGMAFDICKNVKGQEYKDYNFFKQCGDIAKELGITWGGSWVSNADNPHFEISSSWKEPVAKEDDLKIAVKEIAKKVKITESSWNDVSKMNMSYAERLVALIGESLYGANTYLDTVKVLKGKGIINSEDIWVKKQFKPEVIKALLIKIADDITGKNKK